MDRWRFLALEGVQHSRPLARPRTLQQVEQFTSAYRQTATELARVRAFSPDKRLAEYIERGVATSHFAVYRTRRPRASRVLAAAVFGFPALVRKHWQYHAVSLLVLALTTCVAFAAVFLDPDAYYLFVDASLAAGRDPSASTEYLESFLGPQSSRLDEELAFTSFLFTNNTRVAFLCFAWGVVAGLGTFYLLAKTGLMLGGLSALYVQRGLSVPYFAWILPHGVPEIGAIVLCGGAGLLLGHRLINPGRLARKDALKLYGGDAAITALGCVPLLALAGLIEGIFRQSTASVASRYVLFLLMLVGLGLWIVLTRAKARPS